MPPWSHPILPVTGAPTLVGHGDNLNPLLAEPVDEAERKAGKHNAPRSVQMNGPTLWSRKRTLDDKGDLLHKCPSRDEAALGIPVLRVEKLLLCGRVKFDFRIHGGDRATSP